MKALVTGGAGFIGSHLVDALLAQGHQVAVVDDLRSGRRGQVPPAATFFELDMAQDQEFMDAVHQVAPETIFHLAAQASVGASWADPLGDAGVNIGGTLQVLAAARGCGARVVYASSAACYGQPQTLPLDETHPTSPLSPYGVSKLAAEHYLTAFAQCYGLAGTSLRLANVYGPRQNDLGEAGVVSSFIRRAQAGQGPLIHGDGQQSRDFIYVKDVAQAFIRASTGPPGIFNVGTGRACTVGELWLLISRYFPALPSPVYGPPRPGDIRHSRFATTRAELAWTWRPAYSLEDGLEETCSWHRAGAAGS